MGRWLAKPLHGLLKKWWLWLPVIAALLVMLPRVASAQFSLFDDGETAVTAAEIAGGTADFFTPTASGRFQPGFKIHSAGLFLLFDNNPRAVYFVHAALLAVIVGLTALLVRRWSGNDWQAFLSALLVISAGAVIESFYTLSKSETLLAAFILGGLYLLSTLPERKTRLAKGLTFAGGTVLFIAAALTKETFVVMPFIGLVWVILPYVFHYAQTPSTEMTTRKAIFAALFAALLVFAAVSFASLTVDVPGKYSSRYVLSISRILESLGQWRNWLMRDYLYLVPVGMLWLMLLLLNRSDRSLRLGMDLIVFSVAWFLVYLPWEFVQEYYLLLFALGGAVLAGLTLGKLPFVWKGLRIGWKLMGTMLAVATVYFWLTTLPTQVNKARLLLTVDRVNQQMLTYLAEELPANSQVMVNLAPYSEYIAEIALHLEYFYQRPDIDVQLFTYQVPGDGEALSYWLISPQVTNRPIYTVRSGFLEIQLQRANALLKDFASEVAGTFTEGYRQWLVKPFRPVCWVMSQAGPCAEDADWISLLPLDYRWTVYRYESSGQQRARPAVYAPGDGHWQLEKIDGGRMTVEFSCEGCLSSTADIDGDGRTDLGLYDPSSGGWQFDINQDGAAELSLSLPEAGPNVLPLLGDWDGDGRSSPGMFLPGSLTWKFFDEEGRLLQTLQAGSAGDVPLVGDWDGDGRDSIGVYRPANGEVDLENELTGPLTGVDFYGPVDTIPVAGRWAGQRLATLAFYDDGTWQPYYWNRDGEPITAPAPFTFGHAGDLPFDYHW